MVVGAGSDGKEGVEIAARGGQKVAMVVCCGLMSKILSCKEERNAKDETIVKIICRGVKGETKF
ncbi:hypothetical protein HYC85_031439 [Camellia sinensis]|uniref:Uncharacterized protein n=1 Tax=Camellia sinensis TaxID=4442 RepID=A0A7J7FU66_CAMSI|nr:hypothetical protein HYC85_031439 [Camellia sinensis]